MVSFLLLFIPVTYKRSSPHLRCTPRLPHPLRLDNPNDTWRKLQVMKLFVMQFSPPSRHFIPLRCKYSPQHPVLDTINLCSSLNVRDLVSHTYRTTGKIIYSPLCSIIFNFSTAEDKTEGSGLNGSMHYQNSMSSWIEIWFLTVIPKYLNRDTEMRTRNRNVIFLGSKAATGECGRQPYRHLWADCLDNVASLTSHNPIGLRVLLWGYYFNFILKNGARGSLVFKALCYKAEGRGFKTRWGEWFLSIYLILPAAIGPGVYSASNRNEYQKHKNNVSGE
jgi:hypothetical protein